MPTTTITATDLIRSYANDLAYVAEEPAATDLATLINHLATAGPRFSDAGINGHEDLETAATLLTEATQTSDRTVHNALLHRADKLLSPITDMTQEYRDMVGD